MGYVFRKASEAEIPAIFDLYVRRVAWMDEAGIHQWNETDYLSAYPQDYYREELQKGNLFVLENEAETLCGAVVLLQDDERWEDEPEQRALYVHNLVTDRKQTGAGTRTLGRAAGLRGRK